MLAFEFLVVPQLLLAHLLRQSNQLAHVLLLLVRQRGYPLGLRALFLQQTATLAESLVMPHVRLEPLALQHSQLFLQRALGAFNRLPTSR